MRIAIVGAAGRTGNELVLQALEKGHFVRALSRDPAKIQAASTNLEVAQADVLAPDTLAPALRSVDAVLVSLGGQQLNDASTRSEGTKNLIEAMKAEGVARIIIVSTAGVGDSFNQLSEGGQQAVKTVIRVAVEDHTRQEALVQESGLDWTIARPGGLRAENDRTYKADATGTIQINAVNRAALAAFIVSAVDDANTFGKIYGVSGS